MSTDRREQRCCSGTMLGWGARRQRLSRVRRVRLEREGAVRTTHARAEPKRHEKLEFVRQEVQSGSLARRMTEEERRRYPPRPARPNQDHGR